MRAFALVFAFAAFGCCAALPAPASAREMTSPVENCLLSAGDHQAAQNTCVGQFASNCIENTPGGETTAGMVQCVESERWQWENVRGAAVITLRANETPGQLSLLDASLTEHRRWADARCSYEASIYEGGSLSIVIAAQCMRDAVAEHAIYLRNRYSEN
jgi:hypothetical protein